MINPLDSSDLASLIQADWHEEFGDIDYANEIRESVLKPQINTWHWSDDADAFHGIGIVGSGDGRAGAIGGVGVGIGGSVSRIGGVGGAYLGDRGRGVGDVGYNRGNID